MRSFRYQILRCIPKSHLSYAVGRLLHLRLPFGLGPFSVRVFAKLFGIDCSAAAKPLGEYKSIGEFFGRDLKDGLRPIGAGIVSAADSLMRGAGKIEGDRLEQIKGRTYSLTRLLGEHENAPAFENGYYFNFYLSPRDYHHVHAPIGGEITGYSHIPGKLWPVNQWSLGNVPELFSANERVVLYIRAKGAEFALVLVGATNVGRIVLRHIPLTTNETFAFTLKRGPATHVKLERPVPIAAGEKVASFQLGSSAVFLVPRGVPIEIIGMVPRQVNYGETVGILQR